MLDGLAVGKTLRWLVFNGETQAVTLADQRIVAHETSDLFEGSAFKVQTDMLGLHSTTWIDARGLPLLELGMNGVIVSALEEERVAKSYLTSAAVNKDEAILSWSLIKTPLPLSDARHAQFMRFTLVKPEGVSEPPIDSRQTCSGPMRELTCRIDASARRRNAGTAQRRCCPRRRFRAATRSFASSRKRSPDSAPPRRRRSTWS